MNKILLLTILVIFCFGARTYSQVNISGIVTDSLEKKNLDNAIVTIVDAKDSMLLHFTRTDKEGKFVFSNLNIISAYFLVISYPDYADFVLPGRKDAAELNLGKIFMISKVHLLQEVIVKQGVKAIRFNNDTVEYKADSFHVQLNATVEDLLKKFPGFEINSEGKITANGQRIDKVLVDGEEYFGTDPTLVTRNLRADLIDKVQLYDKKSDQAAFTGIDDGTKSRTLNLQIKEDRKNTFFGKVEAGAGTDNYYNNSVMANKFNKKKKIALYGVLSNTGKQGLARQDEDKFGDRDLASSLGYTNTDLLDNWSGSYDGQGFPTVGAGGLHYNDKWGKNPETINGNYRGIDLSVKGNNETIRQDILPNSVLTNYQDQQYVNHIARHTINATYDVQLDSFFSVKLSIDAGFSHKNTLNEFYTKISDGHGNIFSEGKRNLSFTGDNTLFNSNFLLRRKFRKKGRTLSMNMGTSYSNNESSGYLNAANTYYTNGGGKEITDQYKTNENLTTSINTKFVYTEPLSPSSMLSLNYGLNSIKNTSDRVSYNKGPDGKYSSFDSLYSSNYLFNIITHKPGLSYAYVVKKYRFTLGTDIGFTQFDQKEIKSGAVYQRSFINYFPLASVGLSLKGQRSLSVSYSGSTMQPSLSQIQPLRTNNDPWNIAIGNPALGPAFSNNLQLTYVDMRPISRRDFWIQASYNFVSNAISTADYFDSSGKRSYNFLNVNGVHTLNYYMQYGFKLGKPAADVAVSGTFNNYANVNFINGKRSVTNTNTYIFGSSFSKSVDKKLELSFRYSAAYWTSMNSLQNAELTHYWIHNIRPAVDVFLPFKTQFHTDVTLYLMQQAANFNSNSNLYLVNAWYAKKFLKTEALVFKLSVNDLFNSNKGITRTVNTTYATQNVASTIQRYFMLSLTWDFVKAPVKN
jgi:hypothetical protein